MPHLSDAAAAIVLLAGALTAIGTITAALIWLVKPRFMAALRDELGPMQEKVAETHKQVTVNSHASEKPTILDILDDLRADLRAEIRGVDRRLDQHLYTASQESREMWKAIEAVAKAQPPPDL